MMKKISASKQWMIDHPDDVPCPKSGGAAYWWRVKRGIGASADWARAKREWRAAHAADVAMAEKRAREAREREAAHSCDATGRDE
jgi:hypothetical protein